MRFKNILYFLAVMLLTSCGSDSDELHYTMHNKDRELGDADKNARFVLSYPQFSSDNGEEVQQLNAYAQGLITEYNNAGSLEVIEQTFEKDFTDFITEFPESASNNWYLELRQQVVSISSQMVALEYAENQYMGGAHGMYSVSYHTWDRHLRRELRLEDLVKDMEAFQKLMQREYIVQNDLDKNKNLEDQGLFVENNYLPPADNFIVLPDGILLRYNHYEIGPYSMGPSSVLLDKGKLSGMLHEFEWPEKVINAPK